MTQPERRRAALGIASIAALSVGGLVLQTPSDCPVQQPGSDLSPLAGFIQEPLPESVGTTHREAASAHRSVDRAGAAAAQPAPTSPTRSDDALEHVGQGSYRYPVMRHEVLATFQPGVTASEVRALAEALGSRVLSGPGRTGLYRLSVPTASHRVAFQKTLKTQPGVATVSANAVAMATGLEAGTVATSCGAGAYRARQWHLDRIQHPQVCSVYDGDLNSIVVAVLDTGVAYEQHSDASGSYQAMSSLNDVFVEQGYDFIHDDSHPNDDQQHGSHLASIIASRGSVLGVAPGVRILPVKVLDENKAGTEASVAEGIRFAVDEGADILNLSLSFGPGFFPGPALQDAIDLARQKGVTVVGSVGNNALLGVTYPGAFPDAIAVGATRLGMGNSDRRALYSDHGYRVDVLAPGGSPLADFNFDGYPDGILAQTFAANQPEQIAHYYVAGTSQAAAVVSGAAAWMLAAGADAREVKPLLQQTAGTLSGSSAYSQYNGSGIIRIDSARQLQLSGGPAATPEFYVNILPYLETSPSAGTRARARVQVLDGNGYPQAGLTVAGSWFGSYTSLSLTAQTSSDGVATFATPDLVSSIGLVAGFQVEAVVPSSSKVNPSPLGFYSMSPALAETLARLIADPELLSGGLVFELADGDGAMAGLLDSSRLKRSFVVRSMGPGLASGAVAMVFDAQFAPELASPAPGTASPIAWTLPGPLASGRGDVSVITGTRIESSAQNLGSATRYAIFPYDPSMASLNLQFAYPVVNARNGEFAEKNEQFGNMFAGRFDCSSFPTSAMSDDYVSASLGDGFIASSFGSGFMASSFGTGFIASSFGTGFIASSFGTGFMASSFGTGFIASSFGTGFMASSFGTGFIASGFGTSLAEGEGAGGTSSCALGAAAEGSQSLELLTDEEEVEAHELECAGQQGI